jgi:hypothetical protein
MIELDTDIVSWCRQQVASGAEVLMLSMYCEGSAGGTSELGLVVVGPNDVMQVPLTYFTSLPGAHTCKTYSWLIDDYTKYLSAQSLPVRRVLSEIEKYD